MDLINLESVLKGKDVIVYGRDGQEAEGRCRVVTGTFLFLEMAAGIAIFPWSAIWYVAPHPWKTSGE